MEPRYIFIGGAPTTGKSTIAKALAHRLNLPLMATDQIRAMVKPYSNPERHPDLYHADGLSAEAFFEKYTPQQVADMEFGQGAELWPAIMALLADNYDWPHGGIIEGVHIQPGLFFNADFTQKKFSRAIFLVDDDPARIRDVVYNRGLYGDPHTYSDAVREMEIEWVQLFIKRLRAEAAVFNMPCLDVTKTDDDITHVLNALDLS